MKHLDLAGARSRSKSPGFFRRIPSFAWIACFGVFVVALAWLFFLKMTAHDLALEMRRINGENTALAHALEEHVARAVKTTDNALLFLKREYETHGATTQRLVNFIDDLKQDPLLNQVGVANSRGDLLLSAVPLKKPVNIAHREHFQVHAASDTVGLFVAKPVVNQVSGVWSVFLTRRLNGTDGTFAGVVTAGIDPRYFSDYFDAPELGPSQTILLVGKDGIVRARRFQHLTEVGQDISSSPLFELIQRDMIGSYEVVSPVDGLQKLASFHAVPGTSLVVVVSTVKNTALAPFLKRKQTYFSIAGFFTLFTAGFCVLLIRSVRLTGRQNVHLTQELAERERASAALREREQQLAESQRIAHVGSWEHNLTTGTVVWSEEWFRLLGLDPRKDPADFRVFFDSVHPDDQPVLKKTIDETVRTGKHFSADYRLVRRDGTTRILNAQAELKRDATGTQLILSGTGQDITERKLAEKEIRRSEEFIKSILDAVDDGFLVVDKDLRIKAANQSFCRRTNRPLEEILGQPCHAISHPALDQCHEREKKCPARITFETGASAAALHSRRGDAGLELASEVKSYPLRDDAGHLQSVIITVRDVTGKLKMEEQIRNAQKLESVGVLAGGIAHDFNNLLAAILGNVSLAKMLLSGDEEPRELLQRAEEACEHGKELSGRLLTFAKGGEPLKISVALQQTLRGAVSLALSGSNVSAVFDVAGELYTVDADEGQLRQVFSNLTINAREAMPGGGTVEVGAENQLLSPEAVTGLPDGRYVKITFRDHGGGIPPQLLGRIFDPYFSTKKMGSRKGQGLGLTICHSIVNKHEGRITVASEPGKGTVFAIYLPASRHEVQEPGIAPAREGDLTQVGAKILVMDDDARVRDLLGKMLKHFGYAADLFPDNAGTIAAYRAALAGGAPYGLVILDLTIQGGKGGAETFRDLKDIDPHVRAIISSGYADNPILENYQEHGFRAAIVKPYTTEQLRTVLASILRPSA